MCGLLILALGKEQDLVTPAPSSVHMRSPVPLWGDRKCHGLRDTKTGRACCPRASRQVGSGQWCTCLEPPVLCPLGCPPPSHVFMRACWPGWSPLKTGTEDGPPLGSELRPSASHPAGAPADCSADGGTLELWAQLSRKGWATWPSAEGLHPFSCWSIWADPVTLERLRCLWGLPAFLFPLMCLESGSSSPETEPSPGRYQAGLASPPSPRPWVWG